MNEKIIRNHSIHNHTYWSDGWLSPENLVIYAINNNISLLGITDHAFTDKLPAKQQVISTASLFNLFSRSKFKEYYKDIEQLKIKYKDQIKILAGLEIDISKKINITLPYQELNTLDYILFEGVSPENLDYLASIRSHFSVPVGIAHAELDLFNEGDLPEKIALFLKKNSIFTELCHSETIGSDILRNGRSNGKNFYECFSPDLLNQLQFYKIEVAIGTDTHYAKSPIFLEPVINFIEQNQLIYADFLLE